MLHPPSVNIFQHGIGTLYVRVRVFGKSRGRRNRCRLVLRIIRRHVVVRVPVGRLPSERLNGLFYHSREGEFRVKIAVAGRYSVWSFVHAKQRGRRLPIVN